MKMIVMLSVVLMCALSAGADADQPPTSKPPNLWRASATERDGTVVIQISRPKLRYEVQRNAVPVETVTWRNLRQVRLGKFVRAYGVDGKPLDSPAVLKALQQPKGVAVFMRFHHIAMSDPDPFYLAMLREGTIVFVVAADAIADPVP